MPIEEDVRWALEFSNDSRMVDLAVEAVINHRMTEEVKLTLNHRFAHAVARALTAVSTTMVVPLSERLLEFATHRASPVRKALVDILKAKPDLAHQATLIKLAADEWSKSIMSYGIFKFGHGCLFSKDRRASRA